MRPRYVTDSTKTDKQVFDSKKETAVHSPEPELFLVAKTQEALLKTKVSVVPQQPSPTLSQAPKTAVAVGAPAAKRPDSTTEAPKEVGKSSVKLSPPGTKEKINEKLPDYVVDMNAYRVIHIPQSIDGTNNCSGIARRNQQNILQGTLNRNYILFGDAKTKIDLYKKLYTKSGKMPGQPIKVREVFDDPRSPGKMQTQDISMVWLHDDTNVINPSVGSQIENRLDASRNDYNASVPKVREMFIDTHHKHRVTIVRGTGEYTVKKKIPTGKYNTQGKKIMKTETSKQSYTGYRVIDTLRGRHTGKNPNTAEFGKIPLPVYFQESASFYSGHDHGKYHDIYLRYLPIGQHQTPLSTKS